MVDADAVIEEALESDDIHEADDGVTETGDPGLVRGLRSLLREVQEMKQASEREKTTAGMRRGVHHLLRHCAIYQNTFATIRYAHDLSEQALRVARGDSLDYELAAEHLTQLSEKTPSDVPLWYYALASDLFDWCARRLAKIERREKKHGAQVVEPMDEREG